MPTSDLAVPDKQARQIRMHHITIQGPALSSRISAAPRKEADIVGDSWPPMVQEMYFSDTIA